MVTNLMERGQSTNRECLEDVIDACQDGVQFYRHAAEQVDDDKIATLFLKIAKSRDEISKVLMPFVEILGVEPDADGTTKGKFAKLYADAQAAMTNEDAEVYYKQLENLEDHIVEVFDEALERATSEDVKQILLERRLSLTECHNEIVALQKRAAEV